MSDYSLSNAIKTAWSLLLTKISFPGARLVRRPIYIRGKHGMKYGKGFTTGVGCRIDAASGKVSLTIGQNARLGDYVHINADACVSIGDNLLTASKVFISDANHGVYKGEDQDSPDSNPTERRIVTDPVFIGNNVWVGENVVILPGSKIGDGCVIGANTVVNGGDFPDGCVIAGAPARIVKRYNLETRKWEKETPNKLGKQEGKKHDSN